MKYLLTLYIFLQPFTTNAETWVVEVYNELRQADCACSSEAIAGNGCNKFNSENEAEKFIQDNIKVWGEKERWLKEYELRPELMGRIIEEKEVFPESLLTKAKRMIGIKIPIKESYMLYLVKADYTFKIKDITKAIEDIEIEKQKEKEKIENLKKIDIDNMTDEEMKSILKHLLKNV